MLAYPQGRPPTRILCSLPVNTNVAQSKYDPKSSKTASVGFHPRRGSIISVRHASTALEAGTWQQSSGPGSSGLRCVRSGAVKRQNWWDDTGRPKLAANGK